MDRRREHANGDATVDCPVYQSGWRDYRDSGYQAMHRIEAMEKIVTQIVDHTTYLQKLDPIANTIKLFTVVVFAIFLLFAAVTGKDLILSKDSVTATTPTGSGK